MSRSDRFLKACRGEPVDTTPVWIMRQAGRYMAEYRAVRQKYTFLEVCHLPEVACEVTLQPVDRLGVDAAILFSDIMIPLEGMGCDIDFDPGPVFSQPVRTAADVERLRVCRPEEDVPYVLESVRLIRRELAGKVPLIGFSGAPFTLASYMVEGKGSREFATFKGLLYSAPKVYQSLMEKVTATVIAYLNAQIAAGVQAVQLFDTWGGILSPGDYAEYVLPYSKRVIAELDRSVPVIHFVKGAGCFLETVMEAGGDVLGVDWHLELSEAIRRVGGAFSLQGNLDPTVLLGPRDLAAQKTRAVVAQGKAARGHIFNLGHGVLPSTPVETAIAVVEAAHEEGQR
ncbi:MAG: uroporphyrinogen decarboxylase [Deltaproteobacteria bacterium]|nr:uroporphyrinogen decarboxylase [Deltaproteobacteria bacterium]